VIINKGKIVAVDTPQNLTSQLQGGRRIHIDAQAPEKALADALRQIPGAARVETEPARTDGHVTATVETGQNADIRSQIAAKIISSGWPLYELRSASMSLEDIFLELTTDDASHAVPSGGTNA